MGPRTLIVYGAAFGVLGVALGFGAGTEHERAKLRSVAKEMTSGPVGTNTFSKCLIDGWDASGELGDWKNKRRWVLIGEANDG